MLRSLGRVAPLFYQHLPRKLGSRPEPLPGYGLNAADLACMVQEYLTSTATCLLQHLQLGPTHMLCQPSMTPGTRGMSKPPVPLSWLGMLSERAGIASART